MIKLFLKTPQFVVKKGVERNSKNTLVFLEKFVRHYLVLDMFGRLIVLASLLFGRAYFTYDMIT